jgi:replicative DNA helicase
MNRSETPPQSSFSPEAEEAAISLVLNNGKDAFLLLRNTVGTDHFYLARYRTIWQAFELLVDEGGPFDLVAVIGMLAYMGVLENVGGHGEAARLIELDTPLSETKAIAATLHELYLQRASL